MIKGTKTGELTKYVDRTFNNEMSAIAIKEIEELRAKRESYTKRGNLFVDGIVDGKGVVGSGNVAIRSNDMSIGQGKTVLLVHFDGNGGQTSYIAETGQTLTFNGNAQLKTDYRKFGISSLYLDGSGDYVTVPNSDDWWFDNQDFTIDCWIRPASLSSELGVVSQRTDNSNFLNISITTAGEVRFVIRLGGSNVVNILTSGANITVNTWHHIAVVRFGANFYVFVNGVQKGVVSYTNSITNFTGALTIGRVTNESGVNYDFNGYVDEFRIIKSFACWTSDFTPYTSPYDLESGSVESIIVNTDGVPKKIGMVVKSEVIPQPVLLLHCNGINGSTTVRDEMGHSVTCNGNAQISTAQYKFGGGSAYFDGSGDYLTIPDSDEWYFGTDDFTVDCWIRPTSLSAELGVISQRTDNSNFLNVSVTTSGEVKFVVRIGGSDAISVTTSGAGIAVNTWCHIAVVRYGLSFYVFVNGVQKGTVQFSGSISNFTGSLVIGRVTNESGTNYDFNGYIDELRITKGFALWTTDFTPPDREAPSDYHFIGSTEPQIDYNTNLLMHFDGANGSTDIKDECKHLVSVYGNAQISTAQYMFGGSSLYLDGSGDYLKIETKSDDWRFFDNDFTIDFWARFNSVSSSQTFIDIGGSANGITISWLTSNVIQVYIVNTAYTFSFTPTTSIWYHIAVVRFGDILKVFVNGVEIGNVYIFGKKVVSVSSIYVGTTASLTQYFNGWIDELRISRNIARWTTDFVLPAEPYSLVDSNKTIDTTPAPRVVDKYTKLLLHFNGYEGSTTFKDECNHSISSNGVIQTLAQRKWGASAYFNGSSYLTSPDSDDWWFGTQDWTIDFWIMFTSVGTIQTVVSQYQSGNYYWEAGIYTNSHKIYCTFYYGSCIASYFSDTVYPNFQTSVWYHIAIEKYGSQCLGFVNGKKVNMNLIAGSGFGNEVGNLSGPLEIGRLNAVGDKEYVYGYVDELRIGKGIARWIGDFTPPIREYTLSEGIEVPSIQITRDGSGYKTVELEQDSVNNGYYRTKELVDLRDLPEGQNLKYKINLTNANQRRIQGVGLYWR